MANGTIAASKVEMLSQSGTGITTINPPATNTNRTLTLPDVTGTVALNGTTITSGTAVASTSGTSIDFTGIPSWVKRITVMFNGVSTNGTSLPLIQLGDAGGIETTGYVSSAGSSDGAGTTTSTAGFVIRSAAAGNLISGAMTITLLSGNSWTSTHNATRADTATWGAGSKTLSDTLTQVRITTGNGTDTFDAGSINILYE